MYVYVDVVGGAVKLNEETTVIGGKHGTPPAKVSLKIGGEMGSS
jgi:hypothetical protein